MNYEDVVAWRDTTELSYQEGKVDNKPIQYRLGIDTFDRAKANMTKQEILACCKFNIDKYTWRTKNQDRSDFEKIIAYAQFAIDILDNEEIR